MRMILSPGKTIRHPPALTLRTRLQGFARKVLEQEVELLLLTALLLLILSSAYVLRAEPQPRWMSRVETARALWREEIQAMATGEYKEQEQRFKRQAVPLETEPGSEPEPWDAPRNQVSPEFLSRSDSRQP